MNMTTSHAMFLLVAEEMSISRAAERAYVTQQCASDHIRKLEQEYGLPLFARRPKLKLTRAGEVVLQTLRQTQRLEHMMEGQLNELKGETAGEITVGFNPTRARILLPDLLSRYKAPYPKVSISCVLDDTVELAQLLLKGKLDLFIGVDTISHPNYQRQELGRDRVFFLATEELCTQCMPEKPVSILKEKGIALNELPLFPITRNLTASTLNQLINRSLNRHNVTLTSSYYISDYDTQIAMCGSSLTAAFCPSLILKRVLDYNNSNPINQVHIFPISDMSGYLRIDLVSHSGIEQPKYISTFMELTALVLQEL